MNFLLIYSFVIHKEPVHVHNSLLGISTFSRICRSHQVRGYICIPFILY